MATNIFVIIESNKYKIFKNTFMVRFIEENNFLKLNFYTNYDFHLKSCFNIDFICLYI